MHPMWSKARKWSNPIFRNHPITTLPPSSLLLLLFTLFLSLFFSLVVTKDENIANHGYIEEISTDILEKNFGKQKIDQNLWKCKKTSY